MDYGYMSNPDLLEIRNITGTQPFQYDFDVITAGNSFVLDIAEDKPSWKQYLPFNKVLIINNSGVDIKVYFNQDANNFILVPNGVLFPVSIPAIWSVKVTNQSGSTATTQYKLNMIFKRIGMDSDNFSKEFAKSPLGRLLIGR